MNSLIIAAAGCGTRFCAGRNKLLEPAAGRPLIWHTLYHVMQSLFLDEIILVTRPDERVEFARSVQSVKGRIPVRYADGGTTRMESVVHGMEAISPDSDIVLIHDGARPLVDGEAIDRLIAEIRSGTPAALYCMPSVDTMKETDGRGRVVRTPDRSRLLRAQTPQGARTALFRACLEKAEKEHLVVTDDASVCEACGIPVKCLEGKERYFKVTLPEDRERLRWMLEGDHPPFRIGQGYDIHRFAPDRPLVLGGVRLSETDGLLGHSDADVLIHAVMDALLGAAGCPDIGQYFPDHDDRYLDISSMKLLEKVREIVADRGWCIGNVDSTVIAEAPKLAPHTALMRSNLAGALHISPEQINIKATTNETLGAVGRREGIAALASALLYGRRS